MTCEVTCDIFVQLSSRHVVESSLKVMTILTCVFGDGSTVEFDRDLLLSSCSVIKSMMEDRDELFVSLPLIPNEERFLRAMDAFSCSSDTAAMVHGANDANYLNNQQSLSVRLKFLAAYFERMSQIDLHLVVDELVPDVLKALMKRVDVSRFFANMEEQDMHPSPQLQYIAEEASGDSLCWCYLSFKGMARFEKLHLAEPTDKESTKKYIVNLIKENNVDEALARIECHDALDRMGSTIATAACCFECYEVLRLVLSCLPEQRMSCMIPAIMMDNDRVLDYLISGDVGLMMEARKFARMSCKEEQASRLTRKIRDFCLDKAKQLIENC